MKLTRLAGVTLVLALCAALVPARTTAADAPPPGLSAHGTVVGQIQLNGTRISLGGEIAMMTRGKLLRLDLIRLGVPGTDPAVSALMAQFLPQGGVSLVLDQATNATTVWSDAKKKYYVMKPAKPAASPSPEPGATQESTIGSSIVEMLEAPGKWIKDYSALSFSTQLLGRSTVNGHPASNLRVVVNATKKGGKPMDMTADLALAEDQQYLPVRFAASSKAQNMAVRIDFTQISAASPDPAIFAVPAGYAQAGDASEIFGNAIPH